VCVCRRALFVIQTWYSGSIMAIKTKNKNAFMVEFGREVDGRWIAEIPRLPGVMAYGTTKSDARRKVYAIALRTLADKVEQGNMPASISQLFRYAMARR
jgi:predicted RNase H-like HicB family nuclease